MAKKFCNKIVRKQQKILNIELLYSRLFIYLNFEI